MNDHLYVILKIESPQNIFVSANADILLSCAYRKFVSVLIANQRQRIWRNDTNFKMAVYWRVKQREICEFTIKIIHQTQSKQRHFTSLNMANVDSAFLASIWRVSSFNTQWKRNDSQFLTRKLLTNGIENTIMKLWK